MRRTLPFALAVLAVSVSSTVFSAPRAQEPRVVEITAKRFQFTPSVVTLKKDEPVVLRLRSEDVTHGFFQRPLGINTTIVPGQTTDVPLTPHEAGTFMVICHHFCGAGHGGMNMKLVVE